MSDVISVTSGVSLRTGEGFVTISWQDVSGQLSPEEARQHALGIIEAADAAEFDALLLNWYAGKPPYDLKSSTVQQGFQLLQHIREQRGVFGPGSGSTSVTPDDPEQ